MDFYDLKGIVEHLMHVLGMSKVAEYVTEKALPWMHPGRTASVIVHGESIGYLGEVHPAVLKNYGIGTRAVSYTHLGLSQKGAQGMAQMGYAYKEILCPYYTGITIED